jgi:hypothetical protein
VQRLRSQAELLKSLTQHPTLVGSGREGAFRDLVRELLPRRIEVLEGTVAGPVNADGPTRSKRQVDCMLVDTFTYPTLLRSGNLAVVLHQAVHAIVELKGEVVAVDSTEEEAFRQMLVQLGKTKDELSLDGAVVTALLVFDDTITASKLRKWIKAAIAHRNRLLANSGAKDRKARTRSRRQKRQREEAERDALSTGQLPQYIATSSGMLVEKFGSEYRFYEMEPDDAIVYLLVILLRATLLPPEDATSFGVLPPIAPSAPGTLPAITPSNPGASSGQQAQALPSTSATLKTSRLSEAYSEFTTHFALAPTTASDTIDLTDPKVP